MIKQVCDKLTYGDVPKGGGYGNPWEKDSPLYGKCGDYRSAFNTLCYAYGIPALNIGGKSPAGAHVWSVVYLEDEGSWVVVDCTVSDNNTDDSYFLMFEEDYYYTTFGVTIANDPNSILIAKEIIAPGSSS